MSANLSNWYTYKLFLHKFMINKLVFSGLIFGCFPSTLLRLGPSLYYVSIFFLLYLTHLPTHSLCQHKCSSERSSKMALFRPHPPSPFAEVILGWFLGLNCCGKKTRIFLKDEWNGYISTYVLDMFRNWFPFLW